MNAFARNVNDLVRDFYSTRILNRLARESGFVQRSDVKLDGFNFAVAMTLGNLSSTSKSLSSLVGSISNVVGRTTLHDRFDQSAVEFMKRVLEYTLKRLQKKRQSLSAGVLRRFNRILVWDSSSWGVPKGLKEIFEGKGGSGSEAAVFLQYAFDLKSYLLEFFDIAPGITNDQHYRDQIGNTIRKRDLLLFDRGYFSIELFKIIAEKAAYYISRFKIGTTLYIKNKDLYKKLDICKLLKQCKNKSLLEFETFLGKEKIPCRMVCVRLSEEASNNKLRKMKAEAKSRGKQVSKERLIMAQWCVFIANVPSEKLTAAEIAKMYSLRWSIELVFKQLKSTFNIDKINHENEHRLLCELYGILIMAAITKQIHGMARHLSWFQMKHEISIEKLFKFVRQAAFQLLRAVTTWKRRCSDLLSDFSTQIHLRCIKIKQQSRTSSLEKLLLQNNKEKVHVIKLKRLMASV